MKVKSWDGTRSDFKKFTLKHSMGQRLRTHSQWLLLISDNWPGMRQSSMYICMVIHCTAAIFLTSSMTLVKIHGAVERPKGRALNCQSVPLCQNVRNFLNFDLLGCGSKHRTGRPIPWSHQSTNRLQKRRDVYGPIQGLQVDYRPPFPSCPGNQEHVGVVAWPRGTGSIASFSVICGTSLSSTSNFTGSVGSLA